MDAIQFFMTRHGPAHADGEALLQGLTDDQIRQRPHPAVNSIAWLLWHMARVEDMAVSRLVARQPLLIHQDDWLTRLDVTRRDVGTAMTDAEVTELSTRLDLGGLRDYWRAVGERTAALVRELRPGELDGVNDPEYVHRVCSEDGLLVDEAAWVVDYLAGKSRGLMLNHLAHSHLYTHIGEGRVTRALLGYPGR